MSCINETLPVNKVDNLVEMRETESELVEAVNLCCGGCTRVYSEYKQLLAHLYWRHGRESAMCTRCGLRRWNFAPHMCHVLPINDEDIANFDTQCYFVRESAYCFCGRDLEDAPMIGCDGPRCTLQWYHFKCVGIAAAPDGDWFCSVCIKNKKEQSRLPRNGRKKLKHE